MKVYCNLVNQYCEITKDKIPVYDMTNGNSFINGRSDCSNSLCKYKNTKGCILNKNKATHN